MLPNPNKASNTMFRFLAGHLLLGLVTGWSILAIFIGFDFGGLRSLTTLNHLEYLVYPLLAVFFAITFGSTAMGIGIMAMKGGQNSGKGKPVKIMADHGICEMQAVEVSVRD